MPYETEEETLFRNLEDPPNRKCVCLFFALSIFFGVGLLPYYLVTGDKSIPKEFQQFVQEEPTRCYFSPTVFLILGATQIIIGIYGLFHHLRKGDFALNWEFFVPLLCLILALYSIWMEHIDNTHLEEYYTPKLLESQQFYYKHTTDEEFKYVADWDNLQRSVKCCGTRNFTEWNVVPGAPEFRGFVPESCCRTGSDCSQYVQFTDILPWHWKHAEQYIYVNGCAKKSFEFSDTQIWLLSFILPWSLLLLGVNVLMFLYKIVYLNLPIFRIELIESDGTRVARIVREYSSLDDSTERDRDVDYETVTLRHYKVNFLCFEWTSWRTQ